jgi:hypothetical protein
MGNELRCFYLEKTSRVKRSLRRFCWSSAPDAACPHHPYQYGSHDASVPLDEIDEPSTEHLCIGDLHPHDDPLWPKTCPCGFIFRDNDQWQLSLEHIFKRQDTGDLTTLHDAKPGAMWDAPWMKPSHQGSDGQCIILRTPGGDWMIDGPSRNADVSRGAGWTRTGVPPMISVSPSIIANNYHGVLTNGVLRAC